MTNIKIFPPVNSFYPEITMIKGEFDQLIWDKGSPVYHDKIINCPCRTEEGKNYSSCLNCGGSGWVVIERVQTRMALQSMNLETKFIEWSETKVGVVKITALQEANLSFMDRITMIEGRGIYSQIIHFEKYKGVNYGRSIYEIDEVLNAYYFTDIDQKLTKVEDDLINIEGNKLFLNKEMGENFRISIRYKHKPQFFCLDFPRDIINAKAKDSSNDFKDYPISAVGRRAHLVLDKQNLTNTFLIDNT